MHDVNRREAVRVLAWNMRGMLDEILSSDDSSRVLELTKAMRVQVEDLFLYASLPPEPPDA